MNDTNGLMLLRLNRRLEILETSIYVLGLKLDGLEAEGLSDNPRYQALFERREYLEESLRVLKEFFEDHRKRLH
jgi:hypothetical protein